jgi:glycerol uptake facilitator protein
MILIILGDGVVANALLNKSKGQGGGGGGAWIMITAGWAFAVFVGVYASGWSSGAHINPAVTIALAAIGQVPAGQIPMYIIGQFVGAFIGGVVVWLAYMPHWAITEDKGLKLAVFCTGPAVRNTGLNLITEIIGTAMLLIGVLAIGKTPGLAAIGPMVVAFLVWGIGLSLGGPTGYAINPARDLGPRIAHFVLPIAGKGDSDWGYSWIPVVGPIIGGILGAVLWQVLSGMMTPPA